jgi:pro-sigmaK processing inhibitor BofA
MSQNEAAGILACALTIVIIFILLINSPIKKAAKFAANSAIGFIALAALNYAGVKIAINWITVTITGLLGIPGIAVVYFVQRIFM